MITQTTRTHAIAAILATTLATSGCAHTGSLLPTVSNPSVGSNVSQKQLRTLPQATATTPPVSTGTAQFVLTIPVAKTDAVSPGTKSIVIILDSVDGTTPKTTIKGSFNTEGGSHGCTKTVPIVCTLDLKVPTGRDTFTATLYSARNLAGGALGQASVTATIKSGGTSVVSLVPDGIPAQIVLTPTNSAPIVDGTTHTIPLAVSALDASGATIIGPGKYTAPITLAVTNDPNGALTLSRTSITSPATGAVGITVSYDSTVTLADGIIVASAAQAKSATAGITPLSISPSTIPGLLGGSLSESQTVTVQEFGVSGAYNVTQTGAALTISCIPTTCAPAATGAAVRITLKEKSPGSGTLTIHDPNGNGLTLPYSATAISILSSIVNGGDSVDALSQGSDGNTWALMGSGVLDRIGSNNKISTYPLLNWNGDASPQLVNGPDGALWYVDGVTDEVTTFGIAASTFASEAQYQTPDGNIATALASGPDGALWFTENSATIGRVTTSGVTTGYLNAQGEGATAIVAGPDGAMWFIDTSRLFRIDLSGSITSFSNIVDTQGQPYAPAYISAASDLWLASSYGEICDFQTSGVMRTCLQSSLATIAGLQATASGTVWAIGTSQTGQTAVDEIANGTELAEFALPQSTVPATNGISAGAGNTLWLGLSGGGIDVLTLPANAAARSNKRLTRP